MSEHPVDLMAIDDQGHEVYGEVNIDQLTTPIQELLLTPNVPATREAVHAINEADLIIIGPGSFYTSLMPILLLKKSPRHYAARQRRWFISAIWGVS